MNTKKLWDYYNTQTNSACHECAMWMKSEGQNKCSILYIMRAECRDVHVLALSFVGPVQVINTRLESGGTLNHLLTCRPESDLLQRQVEPTGSDTEVGVVRCYVVHTMVPLW